MEMYKQDRENTWKILPQISKNPEKRKVWVAALKREYFQPGDNTRLCGDHFEDTCFINTGKTVRLKDDAVPTVFNFPSHLQKAVKHRKPPTERVRKLQSAPTQVLENDVATEVTQHQVKQQIGPEHSYAVSSPRKLKRRLDEATEQIEVLKKKLHCARVQKSRLKKKVESLQGVADDLKRQNMISDTCIDALEATFCGVPLQLMKRLMKKGSKTLFHPALKAFALTLQFYSTKAYEYVRETFGLGLPHVGTIRRWYNSVDGNVGFSADVFCSLERKVAEARSKKGEVVCALMLDEMSIMQAVEWDGKRVYGYVDIGNGVTDETGAEATEVLVFMLVAVNSSWKVPVGYFLVNKLKGIERANLVRQCLVKLSDIGVKVISLTCDGPSVHIAMFRALGASVTARNLDPSFPHPADPSQKVYVLLDVCHMLKLLRNALATCGLFKDRDGNIIRWRYLEELHEIQEAEGLHLANKLRSAHLRWQSQKMKVKLAVQAFSSSVADALEFCRDGLKLQEFRNVQGTVDFIRLVDKLFDVLNSRNKFGRGMKAAMKPDTEESTNAFLNQAYSYIASLTDIAGNPMIDTLKKTPFIGFMADIKSVQALYKQHVGQDQPLQYLLTYKLSQDHLELFFAAVRGAGGFNNNPTARQFVAIYKRLMMRHDVQIVTGNAAPQDQTTMLASADTVSTIKKSVDDATQDHLIAKRYDLVPEHTDEEDIPGDLEELSIYREVAVGYNAGFVARMVARKTSCPECRSALTTKWLDGSQPSHGLILQKDEGGLTKPSDSTVQICIATEKMIQKMLLVTDQKPPRDSGIPCALAYTNLEELGGKIFLSLDQHMKDTEPDNNHVFALIKAVTHAYTKVRMHHLTKQHTVRAKGRVVRKELTKLILFKHQ